MSEQPKNTDILQAEIADAYRRFAPTGEVRKLQDEQRWIPVSERLPEINVEVLTWDGSEIISDRLWEPEYGPVGFSLTGVTGAPVTHWMPLPAPPEPAE